MARPTYSTFLSVVLPIISFISLVSSSCYCVRDSVIFDCSSTETVCGSASSIDSGAQLCCATGTVCGKDSICHFSTPIANTSGYYLGGCTDPTYKDPVCQHHCTDAGTADIVYNSTSQLWSCCGYPDNTVSCQNPRSDLTFQAIAMNDFPGTSSAASSSTSTSLSSSSTSSSTTSSIPKSTSAIATASAASAGGTTTASQSSSGLSTGAVAGIAVVAVLIGLALIVGLAFLFIRRRRRTASDAAAAANMPGYFDGPGYNNTTSPPVHMEGMSELYTPNRDHNIHGAGMNGYDSVKMPDAIHESDSRAVPAQLYGSESTATELP